jgi:CheY-like chemotaxis protein
MAHILLVEDDEAVRHFVKRALEIDGHTADEVGDGTEALELLNEGNSYALVLSDIKMPVMDGIALALTVARQQPSLPILLMTGYADQRERAHGLEAIVVDIVQKPFSLQTIRDAVKGALCASS